MDNPKVITAIACLLSKLDVEPLTGEDVGEQLLELARPQFVHQLRPLGEHSDELVGDRPGADVELPGRQSGVGTGFDLLGREVPFLRIYTFEPLRLDATQHILNRLAVRHRRERDEQRRYAFSDVDEPSKLLRRRDHIECSEQRHAYVWGSRRELDTCPMRRIKRVGERGGDDRELRVACVQLLDDLDDLLTAVRRVPRVIERDERSCASADLFGEIPGS